MQSEGRQAHWETVYTEKGEDQVSWFQETPTPSLDLIAKVGATPASAIIDIGGGASRLVDNLVKRGFESVTVLDLSEAALEAAKSRLGAAPRGFIGLSRTQGLGAREGIRDLA
jgi:trans-aconitate methyltransferase